ncbi:riboflavin synthase [Euzebya sp.]|uniref:riboflavin synthase n=1 Tax=Euzebya sp. TaxID=1971409 RepID=UPI003518ECB7
MFTGLVEEVGEVADLRRAEGSAVLEISCQVVLDGSEVGDSIAVNGCCLTITDLRPEGSFTCDMMGETLDRTALGDLTPGDPVNLERAMRAGGRLGGHLVQGHVDGVTTVRSIDPHEEWTTVTYALPPRLSRYVVEKGSITIDGVSLTVAAVGDDWFSVGLIPHTLEVTTHGIRGVGDRVDLEVDVIAKYVERMLSAGVTSPYSPGGDS